MFPGPPLFAALAFDRDPLRLADLPTLFGSWLQVAGSLAAVGVVLWLLIGLPRLSRADRARIPRWQERLFLVAVVGMLLGYVLAGLVYLAALLSHSTSLPGVAVLCATAGHLCALLAACLPFVRDLLRVRPRRLWALTRLSFKEAIRRRVLYTFSALLLVFLFATWFVPSKAEDQVRTYVGVVSWVMTMLLLTTAVLLAAFSLPTDIRQQTIHTILTKPVERFEVILGRFLGFFALMTLVLLLMTGLSLLYVVRGVNPEAARESLKARVPLYGDLAFEVNDVRKERAENVGREWDYRSYITGTSGPAHPPQYAVWDFQELPAGLANRAEIPCEFNFDIYRTNKGEENKGVNCFFAFQTWRYDPATRPAYLRERERLAPGPDSDNQLAEKYGYYEVPAQSVTDYHTQSIPVPGGLVRNALAEAQPRQEPGSQDQRRPALAVRVRCGDDQASRAQYVGMAKYDLYLRLDNPAPGSESRLFALNFFKAAFGLWLRLGLILAVAVALSTYLSGVISLLFTLLLYAGGWCQGFLQTVAAGTNVGGGPVETILRLSRRDVGGTPLEETVAVRVATGSDDVFRWVVHQLLHVIPDIDRFDLTRYVAEGFNIGSSHLLIDFVLLAGYLLPWAVLAYYLMKWREIAAAQ